MIKGGVATMFVSDMSRSVQFYTERVGLELVFRAGDHWASIKAGADLMLGLHPQSDENKAGSNGSVQIGLNVSGRIEEEVERLTAKGVSFDREIVNDEQGGVKLAFFRDPDGLELYLCESKWG